MNTVEVAQKSSLNFNELQFLRTGSSVNFDPVATSTDAALIDQAATLLGPNTYQSYQLESGETLHLTAPYDQPKKLLAHLFNHDANLELSQINFLRASDFVRAAAPSGTAQQSTTELDRVLKAAQQLNLTGSLLVKNILVTGSSGTIGSELVSALTNCGYSVLGVDLNTCRWNPAVDQYTVLGDLCSSDTYSQIKQRMPKIDLILHLAAEPEVHKSVLDPSLAKRALDCHYSVMEFARNNNIPVGFSSSREVYGKQPRTLIAETAAPHTNAESPYTWAKMAGENLMKTYSSCYGLPYTVFRYSNVYGANENRSSRVMCVWTREALLGNDLQVFGEENGLPKAYSFTHISDAVNGTVAIARAMRSPHLNGNTYNICGSEAVQLKDVAILIQDIVSDMNQSERGDVTVLQNRTGEINWFQGDYSKLSKDVGYMPAVKFKHGMPAAVKGYVDFIRSGHDTVWQKAAS